MKIMKPYESPAKKTTSPAPVETAPKAPLNTPPVITTPITVLNFSGLNLSKVYSDVEKEWNKHLDPIKFVETKMPPQQMFFDKPYKGWSPSLKKEVDFYPPLKHYYHALYPNKNRIPFTVFGFNPTQWKEQTAVGWHNQNFVWVNFGRSASEDRRLLIHELCHLYCWYYKIPDTTHANDKVISGVGGLDVTMKEIGVAQARLKAQNTARISLLEKAYLELKKKLGL